MTSPERSLHLSAFSILLITVGFQLCRAVRVSPDPNYYVEFNLPTNDEIQFNITAINITGWVGVGISNNGTSLKGSDLFIGGYINEINYFYGDDYHVPNNSADSMQVKDTEQNWNMTDTTAEANGTIKFTVSRALNTTDAEQDVVIEDKTMHLILLYNNVTDDISKAATYIYFEAINLVTGERPDPSTTTNPTTTTPTTTARVDTTTRKSAAADCFGFNKIPIVFSAVILTIMLEA